MNKVMVYIAPLLLAFVVGCHAQEQAHARIDDGKGLFNAPFTLHTAAGELRGIQSPQTQRMQLLLNGKVLLIADDENAFMDVVLLEPIINPSLLLLRLSSGGAGCPATFQIVDLAVKPKPFVSDELGNCSYEPRLDWNNGKLNMNFERFRYAAAQHWIYTPANTKHKGSLQKAQ